jgi:MSHA biogenesis protein MshK
MKPRNWMALILGLLPPLAAGAQEPLAGLSDPTRPYGAGEEVHAGPVLQSTFVAAGQRRALISGRLYAEGDRYGRSVVAEIHTHEVVLRDGARETRLRVVPRLAKDIRQTAGGESVDPPGTEQP